jgi:hypothetical protein
LYYAKRSVKKEPTNEQLNTFNKKLKPPKHVSYINLHAFILIINVFSCSLVGSFLTLLFA